MQTVTETIDMETFILRTHQILAEIECNSTSIAKAKVKARNLLMQIERYLKAVGLED